MAQMTVSSPQMFFNKGFYNQIYVYYHLLLSVKKKKQPNRQNLVSISAAEKQTSKIKNK